MWIPIWNCNIFSIHSEADASEWMENIGEAFLTLIQSFVQESQSHNNSPPHKGLNKCYSLSLQLIFKTFLYNFLPEVNASGLEEKRIETFLRTSDLKRTLLEVDTSNLRFGIRLIVWPCVLIYDILTISKPNETFNMYFVRIIIMYLFLRKFKATIIKNHEEILPRYW